MTVEPRSRSGTSRSLSETTVRIVTNNKPRDVIRDYELTAAERAEFDYINWPAVEQGTASHSFVRYRGELYDLGEFMHVDYHMLRSTFAKWDGYKPDSFFSGMLIRYVDDYERVIIGTYYS